MPSLVTLPPQSSGRQGFAVTEEEVAEWVKALQKVKSPDEWVVSDQTFNNRQGAARYGKLYEAAISEKTGTEVERRSYETDEEGVFRFALRLKA